LITYTFCKEYRENVTHRNKPKHEQDFLFTGTFSKINQQAQHPKFDEKPITTD